MKKNVLILSVLLIILGNVKTVAQDSPFRFGIKGGVNLSSLAIERDGLPDHNRKLGAHLGVTADYTVTDAFFLQTGLSIISKGTEIKGDAPIGFDETILYSGREASMQSQQWNLHVPLYLGYEIEASPKFNILINAGPYFEWGIAGKTKLTGDIIYGDMIEFSTLKYDTFGEKGLESFDMGIGAGVGVDIGEVVIGLNYELGMRDIGPSEESHIAFYNNSSYKNRNISLSLNYRF